MDNIIYVDMDGVCCDFVWGALSKIKYPHDQDKAREAYQNWPMGEANPYDFGSDEFWEKLGRSGWAWWADLDPYPHYKPMMELLRRWHRVMYLPSVPYGPAGLHAATGKLAWIQKQEGPEFRDFVFTHHKELLAKRNTILIDDTPARIEKFTSAGGKAILFPRPWNGNASMDKFQLMAYLTAALIQTEYSEPGKIITPSDVMY